MNRMRVFVAGFHHETNTFAPSPADMAAFEAGAGYPALSRGAAMIERMGPSSSAMGGFIRDARLRGWTLQPSVWAGAMPSARVTEHAFETIVKMLLDDAAQGGFDAIFLDLHGAAVTEHLEDAEGELLQRLRALVGPSMPIVASLDLHANVTQRMLKLASAMTAYRTYPHVDMADTGARAAALLAWLCTPGTPALATHARRLPFLLPLNAQCTLMEPAMGLFEELSFIEARSGVQLSFAMGFPAADIEECGATVFGHGVDAAAVQAAVDELANQAIEQRNRWALTMLPPQEAVAQAMATAEHSTRPVVIADTQDNPGAGADSNTTGMLHALRAAGAGQRFPGGVALGLLFDPAAARAAHAAGTGHTIDITVGTAVPTFTGQLSDAPVQGRFLVRALSNGVVPLHGPMTAGITARLGPCARLEIEGIQVLVSSGKKQMLDLDLYRFLGVEPAQMKILVNKSSVHFRAAFTPVASQILVAQAAGPMAADPADLPWTRLPPSIARRP